jgi:shikimate dehydrogenase
VRTFGLVGKTLGHSWSRQYFEDKFRDENIPGCTYENFPMDDVSGIRQFIREHPSIAGLNVTLPFKTDVLGQMNILSSEAKEIQAVNCIRIYRTGNSIKLEGLNTDSPAFYKTLLPYHHLKIKKALVLGTGGASRAVCHALGMAGIAFALVSRSPAKGNLAYADVTPEIIRKYQLIVNATPAGMEGFDIPPPPIPFEAIGRDHVIYDLVYNPTETLFLDRGKIAGATVVNGLEMLRIQAELSWIAWNS